MSHGAVKSDSLMEQGVVGRDQARRGQPVGKPVTQPVAQPVRHRERHQEQDRESHREKDREMLARVKEFVGDADKLLAEYQQDTDADTDIDMDIEIEAGQPGEFDQNLRESLRMWLRVQVCLRESLRGSFRVWLRVWIRVCLHTERECCVMALGGQLRVEKCDCESVQIAHAINTVEVWETTNSYNGCRQGDTSRLVAIGEMRFENQGLGSKSDSAGSTRWCKT